MWHWWVEYEYMGVDVFSRSKEGWDAKWKAEKNLEGRMHQIPPNFNLPKEARILSWGVEWKR